MIQKETNQYGGNDTQPDIVMKTADGTGHIGAMICDVTLMVIDFSFVSGTDRVTITNTGNIGDLMTSAATMLEEPSLLLHLFH